MVTGGKICRTASVWPLRAALGRKSLNFRSKVWRFTRIPAPCGRICDEYINFADRDNQYIGSYGVVMLCLTFYILGFLSGSLFGALGGWRLRSKRASIQFMLQ